MLTKSAKVISVKYLFMILLLSALSCVTSPDPNREAIKGINITMEVNQLEDFRAQLRMFADKHSLEYTEKFYNADKTFFSAVINGDDFQMVINNLSTNLETVGIGIFNKASPPISKATVDELIADLKIFINQIPNVAITERMLRLRIEIEEDQREKIFAELFPQLQPLADKYSLEYRASSYDPYLKTFLVEMRGNGFRITVEAGQNLTGEINLIFYMDFDNNIVPTITPTPQETLDKLVNDIMVFLGEFSNVTVTEMP